MTVSVWVYPTCVMPV